MAGQEDFLIVGGLDLSKVRLELKSLQRELQSIQKAGAGTGVRVPVLPPKTIQKLDSPDVSAVNKSNKASFQAAVRQQAELAATFAQQINQNEQIISGGKKRFTTTSPNIEKLRKESLISLEKSLGFKLEGEDKGRYTKRFNALFKEFDHFLDQIALEERAAGFKALEATKGTLARSGLGPPVSSHIDTVLGKQAKDTAKEQSKLPVVGPTAKDKLAADKELIAAEKEQAKTAKLAAREAAALEKQRIAAQRAADATAAKAEKDRIAAETAAAKASKKEAAEKQKIADAAARRAAQAQRQADREAAAAEKSAQREAAAAARLEKQRTDLAARQLKAAERAAIAADKKAEREAAAAQKQFEKDNPVLGPGRKELTAAQRVSDSRPVLGPGQKEFAAVRRAEQAAAQKELDSRPILGPGQKEFAAARARLLRATEKEAAAAEAAAATRAKAYGPAPLGSQAEAQALAEAKVAKVKTDALRDQTIVADPLLEKELATATAELTGLRTRLALSSAELLVVDETYAKNTAALATARLQLTTLAEKQVLANPEALAARADAGVTKREVKAATAARTVSDEGLTGRLSKAEVTLAESMTRLSAVVDSLAATTASVQQAEVLSKNASLDKAIATQKALLSNQDFLDKTSELKALKAQTTQQTTPARQRGLKARLGNFLHDPGDVLGGGAVSVVKYALPSAILFGGLSALTNAVKDSEQLAVTFTKLDSQLAGLNNVDRLANLKKQIIDLSKLTGIEAAEVGDVALQLQGAFGDLKFDPGKVNQGGLVGSDKIIRYGDEAVKKQLDAAGKLAVVTGISQSELVDGLTAASFAFGASADRIGDVAVKLETSTGVKAKETISFLGDIGPVADAAGFKLEEFAAIAATAQKRSGQSGSALAEQFGRIIPAITKNSQDFFDLADRNKTVFGDGYANFIKAVQGADTKGIFQGLAKNFDQLDKSSQEFIIQLIGGRREANALLSVFGDTKGLKKATEDAKDAAGTLDSRFAKLQERVSLIFKRIQSSFNQLVKFIIDSGFGEAAASTLSDFQKIFEILGRILSPITAFNNALGSVPGKLAGIVIQLLALRAAMAAFSKFRGGEAAVGVGEEALRQSRVRAAAGAAAGSVRGSLGGLTSGFFPGSREAYRQSLLNSAQTKYTGTSVNRFLNASNADLRAVAGLKGRLSAANAGLTRAMGGSVGVGFLGLTLAFAAYDKIQQALENDKNNVIKLRDQYAKDTRSSAELLAVSRDFVGKESAVEKTVKAINGSPTASGIVAIAAINKRRRDRAAKGEASKVESRVPGGFSKVLFGQDDKKAESLRELLRKVDAAGSDRNIADKSLRSNNKDYKKLTDKIKLNIGLDSNEAIPRIITQVISDSESQAELIQNLINLKPRHEEDQVAINALINYLNSQGGKDKNLQDVYKQIRNPEKALKNAEGDDIPRTVEALKNAFQAGNISLRQYIVALREKLAIVRGKPVKTDQDIAYIAGAEKDIQEAYKQKIFDRQEKDLEVFKLLGGTEQQVNLKTVQNNLNNLNSINFTDPEERRKAAITVIEQTRAFYENVLANTNDLALAKQLIADGFKIPEEVRQALLKSDVETSDLYIELAKKFQDTRNDPAFNKILDKNKGPGNLLNKVMSEVANGGLTAETSSSLQTQYKNLQNSLATNKDLTDTQKENIKGALTFIAQLLAYGGQLPDPGSAKRYDDNGKALNAPTAAGNGTLFGQGPTPDTAGFDFEAKRTALENEGKKADAEFGLRRAQANKNEVLIAQIEKEQALAQLDRANRLGDDDPNKAADIAAANAAVAQADQAGAAALKAIRDAKRQYSKAVADASGNTIASAQADVQAAKDDLAYAQSTGDAAGVANAAAALVGANRALVVARQQQRDAQSALLKAVLTKEDPVLQAQFDLNLAKIQYNEALGVTAKAEAALRELDAERALKLAMQQANYAMFSLREAQLQAIDDNVGAANVAVQLARQQLQDAIARGAGGAEIAGLQAALITADKSARDTLFQTKLDDYKYLLDTGKITKSQYIAYLQAVQSTLAPGTKQFKELELTLRGLKNDIGSDLQANLPTILALPTVYEVRRLNQTSGAGAATNGLSVGYQDNRKMDIQITIGQNMSQEQIVTIMSSALGTGRNSSTVSRY